MKIRKLLFALSCLSMLEIAGATYTIKKLNTPSLCVSGREMTVGDTFDDSAVIRWRNDNQAVKVLSDDNRLIVLSARTYGKSGASTFGDYVAAYKAMATRGTASPESESEHRAAMTGTFVLMDTLAFATSWVCDDSNYFGIEDSSRRVRRLASDGGTIRLTRDDVGMSAGDTVLRVVYVEQAYADTTVITEGMRITVVPDVL